MTVAEPSPPSEPGSAAASASSYPPSAIYLRLSEEFNRGRTRVIISSGQACVLYRLSMVSKEGDWIIAEDDQALAQVLSVLERHGARYRLGAPLSARWLAGGWSAHCEFTQDQLRIRTDFVSRPPRIGPERLAAIWRAARTQQLPVLPITDLIAIKRTLRDRDYPIIGALALRLSDPEEVLRHSIAPVSLVRALQAHPRLAAALAAERPLLAVLAADPTQAAAELMRERLALMAADRARMEAYRRALGPWALRWQQLEPQLRGLPLGEAHQRLVEAATGLLPETVALP